MADHGPDDARQPQVAAPVEVLLRDAPHRPLDAAVLQRANRRAEQARIEEVEEGPEVGKPVFDGRAGEGDAGWGLEGPHGPALLGAGVLDGLGLVGHDALPGHLGQPGHAHGAGIACQHQVIAVQGVRGCVLRGLLPGHAVQAQKLQVWREAGRLGLPVAEQGCRRHEQAGTCAALLEEQGQHLDGLAEAHVVGQAGAEMELA